jgi:RNA recognition motif-containing protein
MEKPQCTVYVNHLVQKGINVDTIKVELRALFEKYGAVLDVHAIKHYKTRGQAWVIFDSVSSATKAIESMNGYIYHGRAFQCNFSRNKSDIISKSEGTYVDRKKRKRNDTNLDENGMGSGGSDGGGGSSSSDSNKVLRVAPKHEERVAPHRILFAKELPDECTEQMLKDIFSSMPGFQEIRFMSNRNLAFIEFMDITSASSSLRMLKHHKISHLNHKLKLNYAKQ